MKGTCVRESYGGGRTEKGTRSAAADTLRGMPRVFRHRLRVRYGECDPQGVVFNANYLAYFDVILTEFWREAIGDYMAIIEDHGADMVVAESRIGFRSPAAFDDEVDFELRVARLGTTAITCHIDARVGDRVIVE